MSAQTTFINNLLNAAFRNTGYSSGTITMKLFKTGLPSTTGVEVSGGGYAAQTLSFSAASAKNISATTVTFTNMPTGQTVVSYGVYDGATLIDENLLTSPFTADVNTNQMQVSYSFAFNA